MLRRGREFFDGRFWFSLTVIDEVGYIIVADDKKNGINLKQYFTKEDESAIATYDALIGAYHREGEDALAKFKIKDRVSEDYHRYIDINKE